MMQLGCILGSSNHLNCTFPSSLLVIHGYAFGTRAFVPKVKHVYLIDEWSRVLQSFGCTLPWPIAVCSSGYAFGMHKCTVKVGID